MEFGRVAVRKSVRSRRALGWAGWTVAPWCLASGLLVSFVADAGQDPSIGATRIGVSALAPAMPAVLVPAVGADLQGPSSFRLQASDGIVREARLLVGTARDLATVPDEVEPCTALKPAQLPAVAPTIDRSHKGDPGVGLRPTFETRLRERNTLAVYRQAALAFEDSDPAAPLHELLPPLAEPPGPDSVAHFEPVPEGITVTTRPSHAGASPGGGIAGATTPQVEDGSTPNVTRAVALASATPAEPDATPVPVAPLPKFSRGSNGQIATDTTVVMGVVAAAPAYSSLAELAASPSEQRCLAEAVYFEARSEPEEGQAAVAQVVLNRVMSGLYPTSICGVVFQNQQRHNACQFSFACEGRALRITEQAAWAKATRVATEVLDGASYVSDIGSATHYHANYVAPDWARRLVKMDRIGSHIFYKLRPGQT